MRRMIRCGEDDMCAIGLCVFAFLRGAEAEMSSAVQ